MSSKKISDKVVKAYIDKNCANIKDMIEDLFGESERGEENRLKVGEHGHMVCANCGEDTRHMDFVVEMNFHLTWVDGDKTVDVLGCDTLLNYTNARMICPCGVIIEEDTEFVIDDTRDYCWELRLKKPGEEAQG